MTSGCGDDSESPHPCCYKPNKVETIYRTLEDIPYILQWAAGEISSKIAFFPGDAVQSGMPGSPVAVRTGKHCLRYSRNQSRVKNDDDDDCFT